MGKRQVNVADRLVALGYDPLEVLVRMSNAAEAASNLPLVAKIAGDILEYTAPKLKSMEIDLGDNTLDAISPETRRARIRALAVQVGMAASVAPE